MVPLFYDRGPDGIPRGWLAFMKASLQTLCPLFSTERMVQEYTRTMYRPSFAHWEMLSADGLALAVDLAGWKGDIRRTWHQVRIAGIEAKTPTEVPLGAVIPVTVNIILGDIPPDQLSADLYCGVLDSRGNIVGGELVPLAWEEATGDGAHRFYGEIESRFCGRHGFMVRVMPRHPKLGPVYEQGSIAWG